jgi:hypothetical protein
LAAHKGHIKVGGRKLGVLNKKTREVKEQVSEVIRLLAPIYSQKLTNKANSKDPEEVADFMDRFEKLLEFSVPKLQRSDNTNEHTFKGSGLKIGYGDKGTK